MNEIGAYRIPQNHNLGGRLPLLILIYLYISYTNMFLYWKVLTSVYPDLLLPCSTF